MRYVKSQSPFMLRWFRLFVFLLGVASIWGFLQYHDSTPDEDANLLLGIAFVYVFAVLVMLIGTIEWTSRSLGLLGTVTSDALLYGLGGASAKGWIRPLSEPRTDLIRSLFIFGGSLLAIGLARWAIKRWRGGGNGHPA